MKAAEKWINFLKENPDSFIKWRDYGKSCVISANVVYCIKNETVKEIGKSPLIAGITAYEAGLSEIGLTVLILKENLYKYRPNEKI